MTTTIGKKEQALRAMREAQIVAPAKKKRADTYGTNLHLGATKEEKRARLMRTAKTKASSTHSISGRKKKNGPKPVTLANPERKPRG